MKKISTVRVNGNMIFKGHSGRLVWISGIAGRSTALDINQAKLFWNRNFRRHRKR
jgi:hypothetical protein